MTVSREEVVQVFSLLAKDYGLCDVQKRVEKVSGDIDLHGDYWSFSRHGREFYTEHADALSRGSYKDSPLTRIRTSYIRD